MTTIDKALDLDLAPARRTIRMRLLDAAALPGRLLRVMRNRREIGVLRELPDSQLADIGLTRQDVDASLLEGRFSDPSGRLTVVARTRRPVRRGW